MAPIGWDPAVHPLPRSPPSPMFRARRRAGKGWGAAPKSPLPAAITIKAPNLARLVGADAHGVKLGGVEVIVWYSKYELKRRKLMGSRPLFRNRREKYVQANLSLRHEGCFPSQVFACCPCFASKSPGRTAQPEPQRSQRVLGCAELLGSQEQRARVTASAPWSRCRGGDNSPFLPSQERGVPKSR